MRYIISDIHGCYQENGHIAIGCGCTYGGNLAAYCIETGGITYVKTHNRLKRID